MKTILFLIINLFIIGNINSQNDEPINKGNLKGKNIVLDSSLHSLKYMSLSEAETILGQSVYLKDSTWKYENTAWKFFCKYRAIDRKDSLTRIYAEVFYAYEQYKQVEEAKKVFDYIKNENEKTLPVNNLDNMGDEGFMIKDQLNNPFLLIRRGNKIYKLKTYNVYSKSSYEELLQLTKKIIVTPL